MREILFRGKRKDDWEWVEGYFCPYSYGSFPCVATIVPEPKGQWEAIKVIPETVGQFTGLTDKNGKRIFEGDILKISVPIYQAKPMVGISGVFFEKGCFCVNWGARNRTRLDDFASSTEFEVIGNNWE